MSESAQRGRVIRGLRALHAVPVENPVRPGTPDVNYVEGWLELKKLRRWPVGAATPVRVPHFRREQRLWITRRAELGGRVHVLLQVARDWLLIPGLPAAQHLGYATKEQLLKIAERAWLGGIKMEELAQCLSSES